VAGRPATVSGRLERVLRRIGVGWLALGFLGLALVVYLSSDSQRADFYDHFVWQAHAFLQGRAEIQWPVNSGPFQNGYFQDVLPLPGTGLAQLPFPPLPAIVLLPFVAVFGLETNGAVVAAVLGAVNVALCWLVLVRVTRRLDAAALATIFYGFGTVAWYASMLGSTWFLAHVVASTFLFLAIGVAVRSDPAAVEPVDGPHLDDEPTDVVPANAGVRLRGAFVAGVLFGIGACARLTAAFGAPFFAFVGPGGFIRRSVLAAAGTAIPLGLLVTYNLATTGAVLHPAYQHLYEVEYRPRPDLIHPEWGIEDVRYIPQNAGIMLGWPPQLPLLDDPVCQEPAARPSGLDVLLDRTCPLVRPDPLGMSLLLTSPAYLLGIPAILWGWRRRIVAGAALAVLAIALIDLAHFSQGWVQFGYRFSNDFAPFAVLLVALTIARSGIRPLNVLLVGASVLINAWGVWWGVTLGW
jgi:hypothetical protein